MKQPRGVLPGLVCKTSTRNHGNMHTLSECKTNNWHTCCEDRAGKNQRRLFRTRGSPMGTQQELDSSTEEVCRMACKYLLVHVCTTKYSIRLWQHPMEIPGGIGLALLTESLDQRCYRLHIRVQRVDAPNSFKLRHLPPKVLWFAHWWQGTR